MPLDVVKHWSSSLHQLCWPLSDWHSPTRLSLCVHCSFFFRLFSAWKMHQRPFMCPKSVNPRYVLFLPFLWFSIWIEFSSIFIFYFRQVRGTLLAISVIARQSGYAVIFLMGSFLTWRQCAIYIGILPVIIVIAICFVSWISRILPRINHWNQHWFRLSFSHSFFRFRRHQIGCYQKIVQKMRKSHCSGCVDGANPNWFKMNLPSFRITRCWWRHAFHVHNNRSNAIIRRPMFSIKSASYGKNATWNHSSSSFA